MAKIKYEIAGYEFTSKKAVADHIRDIVERNKSKRSMIPNDENFMMEFFNQFHYNASKRLDIPTFSHLTVGKSIHKAGRKSNQLCFFTVYKVPKKVKGKETGEIKTKKVMMSWKTALDNANKDEESIIRRHFLAACRDAVRHQTSGFKRFVINQQALKTPNNISGYGYCQLTGKMTPYNDLHVDHIHPKSFLWLVDTWIKRNNIDFTKLEFTQSRSGLRLFKDKSLQRSWKTFHLNNCQLQLISKEANLSMGGIQEKGLVKIPNQFKDQLKNLAE